MDFITYDSTLKASGKEYRNIVFWNRFIRNPIELILTWTPAVASIVAMVMGYMSSYLAVIYAACWAYPLYIFGIQFKNSVNYHLRNRAESESAPCKITLTELGIQADIPDFGLTNTYEWANFTTIYYKLGYYMFFQKGTMLAMLREADIPAEMKTQVPEFIKKNVDMNQCKVLF